MTLFANWTGWIRPPGRSKSGCFCGMSDQNQPQKGAFRTKTGLPTGSPDQNQPAYVGLDQMVSVVRAWTNSHAPPRTERCLDLSTDNLSHAALCLDQAESPWICVGLESNSQPLGRLVPVSLQHCAGAWNKSVFCEQVTIVVLVASTNIDRLPPRAGSRTIGAKELLLQPGLNRRPRLHYLNPLPRLPLGQMW